MTLYDITCKPPSKSNNDLSTNFHLTSKDCLASCCHSSHTVSSLLLITIPTFDPCLHVATSIAMAPFALARRHDALQITS